jgi:TPR repeat protein
MYINGLGLKKDDAEAAKWFRMAADRGGDRAQYNLGVMYDTGTGVPMDDETAVKWYRRSAEQGYASAQNDLGAMYDRGEGVRQDLAEAYAWFSLAAESDALARENQDGISARLSPEDRRRAQQRAKQLRQEIEVRMSEARKKAAGK